MRVKEHRGGVPVGDWLKKAAAYLASREIEETEANIEFLMAHVLGSGRADVKAASGRILTEKQGHHFWELVKERARRVPLAYVLGSQPFMGLDIKVTGSVLVPRPETEELVEAVIEAAKDAARPLHIVDIGTGSGCAAIALAKHLPRVMLYATEISAAALAVAEDNARRHNLSHRIRFLREDFFKPHKATAPWADIVVTNPPYVPTAEVKRLAAEVRREPVLALDGGKDGLAAIRAIAADVPHVLKPGGRLFLEFGAGQVEKVRGILRHNGFGELRIRKDFAGLERIAEARLPEK